MPECPIFPGPTTWRLLPHWTLKCQPSLHSRRCYSSLALRLQRFLPQTAPSRQHGAGYEATISHVGPIFEIHGLLQSYNSLNQNPCTVLAYMVATCNNGCECPVLCVGELPLYDLSCPAFTIDPLGLTGTSYSLYSNEDDMCKCNTIAYSLISACSACQGGIWHT